MKRERERERERERKKERDVSASTPSSVDWWWRWRRNVSFLLSLSLFMSISLLRLFSRAHYWVNKYILKMRVSSKELFSTLKNLCEYVIVHTILGGSPVILWISLGGKPKWLPLKFGYHDVMRTSPITSYAACHSKPIAPGRIQDHIPQPRILDARHQSRNTSCVFVTQNFMAIFNHLFDCVPVRILTSDFHHQTPRKRPKNQRLLSGSAVFL